MTVSEQITASTNRHVGRILGQLDEANMPKIALDAVKREMWFLHDDIQQVVSQKKEIEDDNADGNR